MQYNEEIDSVKCLECGNNIKYGRSDKKFCCEGCKNKFNNRRKSVMIRLQSRVIHSLDKNYQILDKLLRSGADSVMLPDALQWGFNPEYMTSCTRSRMRTIYRCYDIKYCKSDTRLFNISRIPQSPMIEKKK